MKQLFLLLPLLLTPAAQAMDYVKCEAMQKAMQRVMNSREQKSSDIWESNLRALNIKECGPEPTALDPGNIGDKWLAWSDCTSAAYRREYDNLKTAEQLALKEFDAKAKLIQADYEAEGCY